MPHDDDWPLEDTVPMAAVRPGSPPDKPAAAPR
jgi:hypothetical protein